MDFINKKDIALGKIRKQCGKITGVGDRRAAGDAKITAHLVCNDGGKRGLAEPGRPVEKRMVESLAAELRSLNVYLHMLLDILLPDVFRKKTRTKTVFGRFVFHEQ